MTFIVSPRYFKSKAALAEALNLHGESIIDDPSVFNPRNFAEQPVGIGEMVVVVNHPLRTKFAQVTRRSDGWKVK